MQIPYVQSHSGSKIVDAEYRGFVQELYEKNGTANYFTIDETNQNFTLPMGEIYGILHLLQTKNLVIIKLFNF